MYVYQVLYEWRIARCTNDCKINDMDERIEVITFLQGNENECIETMYESHHWNFRLQKQIFQGIIAEQMNSSAELLK